MKKNLDKTNYSVISSGKARIRFIKPFLKSSTSKLVENTKALE